jgi:predicted ATPase/DNA-binding SARP family transcriptional activator
MRFGILGPTQVRLADGREVAVGGPGLRALLALLLVDAGRVVTAERLIDGLYGGSLPSGAANALQSQVSRLRHLLRDSDSGRPGPLVEFHPAGYRLAVDAGDVDAHRFERLAADGRRALAAGDRRLAAALLRQALDLWRGPALADVGDAPFVTAQAARLEELRLATIEDRVEAELGLGEHRGLVAELQELVARHPLRERLRVQLMRALYGGGRQAEALGVFEDTRRALAEELGADPGQELAAMHLAVLRADPALATAAPPPSRQGLPAQFTSFVGRTEDVRRVGKLLGEARLVTLTGPGGAGKTRLAVEAAGREPTDVCFVQLAPLGDGADVPLAVLGALGVREAGLLPFPPPDRRAPPPPDTGERLVAALADRELLLVLDNCEHVVEAVARLAHWLLTGCPTLLILATSREALGITGETLCPVPPLPLPPKGATPVEALGSPAVRLFADRAAAVRPDFAVSAANVGAVVRICQVLDGLPLAIELAAARLRALPLAELAARLGDRFRLLSHGSRTADPRHHTLRAVVQWSWDLLDDTERTLARRLTVFVGGATLESAERVCGLPATEVVEVLTSLVDKSLVEAAGEDEPRYRMLGTVHAFCAERLAEAAEQERLRAAHSAYFLDLAVTAEPHLRDREQLEWLRRLDAEHDNLNAALRQAVHTTETGTALRLVAALSWYWWLRGRRSEGTVLAGELLDAIGPEAPPGLEEEYALCVLNVALTRSADPALRTRLRAAESFAYGDTLHWPPRYPFLSVLLGMAAGPPEEDMIAEVMRHRQIGPDPWYEALAHLGLGLMRLFVGAVATAESELTAALDGFRAVGDRWGMGMALAELAMLAGQRGERERSIALTDEALDLVGQLDAADDMASLLCRRAEGSVRAGDLADAHADYERAAELARRAGTPEMLAAAHHGLGEVARLRGDLGRARRLYETALAVCRKGWFSAEEIRADIFVALVRVAEAEGDAEAARAWHRQVLSAVPGTTGRTVPPAAAEALAGVALLEGDGKRAALLLGVGRALRGSSVAGDPDVARVAAAAKALIGDAAYEQVHRQGAELPREQALALLGAPPSAPGAPPSAPRA